MKSELMSMTAYGLASENEGDIRIDVEVRSLNHRFLDVSLKVPRVYAAYERAMKLMVGALFRRGKVDVFVSRREEHSLSGGTTLTLNRPLYDQYMKIYRELLIEHGAGVSPDALHGVIRDVLSRGNVITGSEENSERSEKERELLYRALGRALDEARQMRVQEGSVLREEILSRLGNLEHCIDGMSAQAVEASDSIRARLEQRLKRLGMPPEVEPQRLAQEVCFLADRMDVSEELVRLRSHCGAFRQRIEEEQPGKELDFLTQELGRELNTVSSKIQSAEVSHIVVRARGELEKIREQLQNIE